MKQNQITRSDNYFILFSIISGFFSFVWYVSYTRPMETINQKGISLSSYLNILYLNNHPVFNYLNGLWLMFGGILFFCVIVLLEIPQEHERIKQEIKEYIKKWRNNRKGI
jgi:hypothetical protein